MNAHHIAACSDRPHGGAIEITQGDPMSVVCRLRVEIPPAPGASLRVSGTSRIMSA